MKLLACLFETGVCVGAPLAALIALAAAELQTWKAASWGALGFVLAYILGQFVFGRGLDALWREQAQTMGLKEPARRKFLISRGTTAHAALSAFFEQGAKALLIGWLLPPAVDPLRLAAALGVGHGGLEAAATGLLVGYVGVVGALSPGKPVKPPLAGMWRFTSAEHLVGALARLAVLAFHVSTALLIVQTALSGNPLWLLLALAHHFAQDYLYLNRQAAGWNSTRLLWIMLASAGLSAAWAALALIL